MANLEHLQNQMEELGVVDEQTDAPTAKDAAMFGAEFIPGVGEALSIKRAKDAYDEGDYLGAGIEATAGLLGLVPAAGDLAGKGLRTATKSLRKQDIDDAKKLMTDDAAAEAWKKENKLPESQRQKRVPEVQQAAKDLSEGAITSKEYRRTVTANQPIKPITKDNFPDMPTKTEIVGALKATDPRKVDTGIIGLNKEIADGTRVGSRLDIPSYDNYDKWIVSLHDGTKTGGKAIGYGQTAVLKDVEFKSSAKGGLNIAKEKSKATIARIHGDYYNADPEEVYETARILMDDPQWTQVGMNPFRHSYFYDKATGKPVTRADEVIQVGPLVLAKGVKQPTISELKELGVKTKSGKIRLFNEGGAVLNKQMELFEDGGLADEGGTVDPVSGNDVPPGSTQKEVRDDIPAQLSEGEFVFPADVVRFWGLDKLMQMRQQAKMGLKMMEDMGQMGNADEATIPDDLPFDINDIDMEDDGVLEYNVGGYVPNQQMGIAGYQPSAMQPQAAFTPYTPPTLPTSQPLQQAAVPTMAGTQVPQFGSFMQASQGQAPENREYINPQTQERRTITFISGNPVTPIPEGFVPLSQYKPTETATTPTTPQTTRVTDGARDEKADGTKGATASLGGTLQPDGTVKDFTKFQLSYDIPGSMPGVLGGIASAVGITSEGLPEGGFAKISKEESPDLVLALTPAYANKTVTGPNKSVTSDESKEIVELYEKLDKAGIEGQFGVDTARELAEAIDTGTLGRQTGLGSGPTERGFGGTGLGRSDLDLGLRTTSGVDSSKYVAPTPQRDDNDSGSKAPSSSINVSGVNTRSSGSSDEDYLREAFG